MALAVLPAGASVLAMVVGALALFGWKLGLPVLIRIQPDFASMRPNTAAAFMLAGMALWFLRQREAALPVRRVAQAVSLMVAALGAATLAQDAFDVQTGIDTILYATDDPPLGARMAEMSSASFILLGVALFALGTQSAALARLASGLTVLVGGSGLLAVIGYLYGAEALYAVPYFRAVAVHSAVLFLVMAVGVACALPETGVVRLLLSDTMGGKVARRILPPVVVLPLVLGWGILRGAQLRGYDFEFGVAMYTLVIIGLLATLVWGSARELAETDSRRLAAEDALRTEEERHRQAAHFFRCVLDSLPDGVSASGPDGRIILANAGAQGIINLAPPGALISERWRHYGAVGRDGITTFKLEEFPIVRALKGETVKGTEMLLTRASPPVWVSVSASPLRDSDGRAMGAVAVFRDISDRRTLEAQLFVADRLASVGLLAAGVAHEINNPLAVVSGNLQLLSLDIPDGSRNAGMLDDALAATERIRQIVRDLKTLSRGDAEVRSAVDVREVLESTVRVAWNEIRHKATLVKDLQPAPMVLANPARLGQVFLNLIVNAAQAIPDGDPTSHRIRVSHRPADDGRVLVEVQDSGAGIPTEVRSRLFTPFFTTKPVGVGTGLGLSICQRLVMELGGEITVDSQPGQGATFRVYLPGTDVAVGVPAPRVRAASASRGARVLVVDDEADIGELIRIALFVHVVVVCTRGAEALALLDAGERFDVILCDLMMPGMTGMEVFAALRERHPDLAARTLFLTGGAFTPTAQRFLAETAPRFLEKPFDIATLRNAVDSMLPPGSRAVL